MTPTLHSSSRTRPAPPILSPNAILVVTTDLEIVYAWVRAWTRCKNYAVQTMTEAEILARNNPDSFGRLIEQAMRARPREDRDATGDRRTGGNK